MARSRLRSGTKGKHLDKNVWSYIQYRRDDPEAPYSIGQILHAYPQGTDLNFIPCMPKPDSGSTMTRVPYQAVCTFLGMVEFIGGAKCMHFLVDHEDTKNEVLMGLGCLPHLCNIPKRPTKGLNAKPKRKHPSGSGRGGKKSPLRLARMQAKKRKDAKRFK